MVFSSDNKTLHAGSFVPPGSAPLGVALRLRVAADYANATTLPTAGAAPHYFPNRGLRRGADGQPNRVHARRVLFLD